MMFAVLGTGFFFYKQLPSNADEAIAFINSLEPDQKKNAVFPFYDLTPHEWSFLPASTSYPDGVSLKDLDSIQKPRLNNLLQAYLSTKGYIKTKTIMDLENVLHEINPGSPNRIPENYFVAIYGTPNKDSAWGWSFQGHHVALNFTVVKDKIAFAPFFFGSNPAEVKDGPKKGTRAITDEEDIAFDLINTFTEEQRQKAIFQLQSFVEIVTSTATQVAPLPDVGIPVKGLTNDQRGILNKLLSAYLSSMPGELANMRLKQIQAEDFNAIHFGWAGATKKGEPHYYRIQGKTFLIEFDNTLNNANHIHTVWRDFNGDFGRDLLREHYQTSHHH
jgi:hypothetical protein